MAQERSLVSFLPPESYSEDVAAAVKNLQKLRDERGVQALADLSAPLLTNNIIKDKALIAMRDVMRDQENEIQAYEQTLGRQLTEAEMNQFIRGCSAPALLEASDNRILKRLCKKVEGSKQLAKQPRQ